MIYRLARAVAIGCRLLAIGADAIASATQPAPTHVPDWVLRAHR